MLFDATRPTTDTHARGRHVLSMLTYKRTNVHLPPFHPQKQVTQILARLCEEQARPMPTVSQAAWRFLTAYDFPGAFLIWIVGCDIFVCMHGTVESINGSIDQWLAHLRVACMYKNKQGTWRSWRWWWRTRSTR